MGSWPKTHSPVLNHSPVIIIKTIYHRTGVFLCPHVYLLFPLSLKVHAYPCARVETVCSLALLPLRASSLHATTTWVHLALPSCLPPPNPRPLLHACHQTPYPSGNGNLLWLLFVLLSSLVSTKNTASESISSSCQHNDVHPHFKLSCGLPFLPLWQTQNFYHDLQTLPLVPAVTFPFHLPEQDRLSTPFIMASTLFLATGLSASRF